MVINAAIEIVAGDLNDPVTQEIYRNLQVLYGSQTGEQALDRDFGIDVDVLDQPQDIARQMLTLEYVRKTRRYEPRARVDRVLWEGSDPTVGIMSPKVVIEIV